MITVRRYTDGPGFARVATPFLLRHEAINNLALRILGRFADGATPVPPDVYLAVVFAADPAAHPDAEVVGVALRTPPYPLALGFPSVAAVPPLLADALAFAAPAGLSGVIGESGEAAGFAAAHSAATGAGQRRIVALRVHVLTRVELAPGPGELAPATEEDSPLLEDWLRSFHREVLPEDPAPKGPPPLPGFFLWRVDGAPVTMLRAERFAVRASVINAVYTPPAYRRRGYATSAVAAASARCLAEGNTSCALFTDLANPTSNAIYARIGYRPVADFLNLAFTPASAA